MAEPCDICGGNGHVRLPVRPPRAVAVRAETPPAMVESSRSYPCPQCANIVSDDHVKVLDHNMMVETIYMSDQKFMPAMRRNAVYAMADRLVGDGFVTFRLSKDEDDYGRKQLRAELGVVSPAHVATLEVRVAERQDEVAKEVVEEAQRLIDNWGSYYGQSGISKSDAHREIGQAFMNVLRQRGAAHG